MLVMFSVDSFVVLVRLMFLLEKWWICLMMLIRNRMVVKMVVIIRNSCKKWCVI